MWEKEIPRRYYPLWSFYGLRNFIKPFSRKFSPFSYSSLRRRSGAGFTLIELLVVISTLSVLISLIIVVINPKEQLAKARDTQRKNDLAQIQRALELYYQDNGQFPVSSVTDPIDRITKVDGTTAEWGTDYLPYLNKLPKEPSGNKYYVYISTGGQSYTLYASLDRGGRDQQACNSNGNKCSNAPNDPWPPGNCGDVCNFGVSSSNVSP